MTDTTPSNTLFELALSARDYECDAQGIVNNAVYANYFEHTRHAYLRAQGFRFSVLHDEGIDLVLSELNLKFHQSLVADDEFVVTANPVFLSPARLQFEQTIIRSDGQKMVSAIAIVVCVVNGRVSRFPQQLVSQFK